MKRNSTYSTILGFVFVSSFGMASEINAEQVADAFYALNYNSKTPHMKINHTSGFCSVGSFEPNPKTVEMFDIKFLEQKEIPALVRYSLGGTQVDDRSKGRGMAIKLNDQNGGTWTMVMLNSEINFARTPEEFLQYITMRIPVNGKVDTQKIKQITESTPSFKNFEKYMANVGISKSVANTAYYSAHTFWFKTKDGREIAARWKFVPKSGVEYFSDSDAKKQKKNYLEKDFKIKVAKRPIVYQMYLVLANPEDSTNDTTALWKGKHKELVIGKLSVRKYEGSECNRDVFFPNDLPNGINPPKDPLFEIRNEVYGITFGKRQ